MPFAATLGIETLAAAADEVRARLAHSDAFTTTGGALHGGVIMALADACGGMCASFNLPKAATGTTTIESKTNFLRAARGGNVDAVARPLHVGRTIIAIETEVCNDDGKLVAKVTQSQGVLRS